MQFILVFAHFDGELQCAWVGPLQGMGRTKGLTHSIFSESA